MKQVQQHLNILGHKVEDKVTNFSGAVVSVSFDLFGCVMAFVKPPMKEDGKNEEGQWFDVSRLTVSGERVMEPPPYFVDEHPVAQGKQGAAFKTAPPGL